MASQFVLFEAASGYCLFEAVEVEEIGALKAEVQASVTDLGRFSKLLKLKAFQPFKSAENALINVNDISEGVLNADLRGFLEASLPAAPALKPGKSPKWQLGVAEPKIGTAIQEALGVPCNSNDTIAEIVRGVRMHLAHYIPQLGAGNLQKAQLGLAHSYSRAKVKFNVNRSDNMIIQAIALLDQLDKDLNTFAMRVREWYGWHFPELAKLVKDNYVYARIAKHLGDRTKVRDDQVEPLTEILGDEDAARAIVAAAKTSMGMDISETDLANVDMFTGRLVSLAKYRQQLHDYLHSKMNVVAPNLAALIGDSVGARLISHAGSLTNLAKCPASTVQILGAEKALFRALKTKGNTPKYGLIFHSTFIGRAGAKNKGRISRYLANKCAIASRIDSFSEKATSLFGERLRDQVEERLKFYESGEAPHRNIDVMHGVLEELAREEAELGGGAAAAAGGEGKKKQKKEKKSKLAAAAEGEEEEAAPAPAAETADNKKRRREAEAEAAPVSEKKVKKKREVEA